MFLAIAFSVINTKAARPSAYRDDSEELDEAIGEWPHDVRRFIARVRGY
jgi:hypothetical protein